MKYAKRRITFAKKDGEKKVFDKIHVSREEFQEELDLSDFLLSIERELDKKHMTKYAFAKKSGLKPQVVSRVFTNGNNAEVATLRKMAREVGKKLLLKLA
jgi:hypothetical protein